MVSISDIRHFFSVPPGISRICNLSGSSLALLLSLQEEPFIVAEQTEEAASGLFEDIRFFLAMLHNGARKIHFLPEPNGPEASGKRAQVVHELTGQDSIVTSVNGVNAPVWLPEELERRSLRFETGREMERDVIENRLRALGYRRVSIVLEKGEYSAKGWLLDIFPSTAEYPLRIEFFGDEIERIKSFDIDSQRSIGEVEKPLVFPAAPPSTAETITLFTDAGLFLVDSQRGEPSGRVNAIHLSRFDIKGEGHDAGLLSLSGLGIYPDERRSSERRRSCDIIPQQGQQGDHCFVVGGTGREG